MVINKKLRSGEEKIDTYISQLEEALLKKETSSINQYIIASNKVAKVFAEDLEALADDREEDCRILTNNKDDKAVERIILLLKNSELFSSISKMAEELIPEVVNEAQDLKIKLEDGDNAFEKVQERVKKLGKG